MPKLVYALIGADALLQQESLLKIMRELPPDAQRVDVDGESAELAEILDELRSFAMFGGGKVVVIRNADAFITKYRSQLEDYVAAPSESSTLVLRVDSLPANQRIYKAIAKTGAIIPCEPPKDLEKWVIERGRSPHKLTVSREAAALLADLIGADLGRIDNELAKLAISSDSGKVGAEQIAGSVAFQRDREMWDLTNALASGDQREAMRRWRQLIGSDSSAEFRAVTWLCIWLENCRKALAMLKQGQNAFTIGQALRIWPRDMQQKFVDNVRALGEQGVRHAIDLLAEIDFQTKTGIGNAPDNVERFILSLNAL
jgi:DNA polymerase III subunit delta